MTLTSVKWEFPIGQSSYNQGTSPTCSGFSTVGALTCLPCYNAIDSIAANIYKVGAGDPEYVDEYGRRLYLGTSGEWVDDEFGDIAYFTGRQLETLVMPLDGSPSAIFVRKASPPIGGGWNNGFAETVSVYGDLLDDNGVNGAETAALFAIGAARYLKQAGMVHDFINGAPLDTWSKILDQLMIGPVVVALKWASALSLANTELIHDPYIRPNYTGVGLHSVLIDEVDTVNNRIWIRNSHGNTWGEGGRAYFPAMWNGTTLGATVLNNSITSALEYGAFYIENSRIQLIPLINNAPSGMSIICPGPNIEVSWVSNSDSHIRFDVVKSVNNGELIAVGSTLDNTLIDYTAREDIGAVQYGVRAVFETGETEYTMSSDIVAIYDISDTFLKEVEPASGNIVSLNNIVANVNTIYNISSSVASADSITGNVTEREHVRSSVSSLCVIAGSVNIFGDKLYMDIADAFLPDAEYVDGYISCDVEIGGDITYELLLNGVLSSLCNLSASVGTTMLSVSGVVGASNSICETLSNEDIWIYDKEIEHEWNEIIEQEDSWAVSTVSDTNWSY
jgi:hypothetical protein